MWAPRGSERATPGLPQAGLSATDPWWCWLGRRREDPDPPSFPFLQRGAEASRDRLERRARQPSSVSPEGAGGRRAAGREKQEAEGEGRVSIGCAKGGSGRGGAFPENRGEALERQEKSRRRAGAAQSSGRFLPRSVFLSPPPASSRAPVPLQLCLPPPGQLRCASSRTWGPSPSTPRLEAPPAAAAAEERASGWGAPPAAPASSRSPWWEPAAWARRVSQWMGRGSGRGGKGEGVGEGEIPWMGFAGLDRGRSQAGNRPPPPRRLLCQCFAPQAKSWGGNQDHAAQA